MMKAINYTAKVLPDGHISLPHEIKEAMGLAVNSVVKITFEKDVRKENALKAFGVWSERSEIKGGIEYVEDIKSGWIRERRGSIMHKARFLVDTDIIINYLKGRGNARDFLMKTIHIRIHVAGRSLSLDMF